MWYDSFLSIVIEKRQHLRQLYMDRKKSLFRDYIPTILPVLHLDRVNNLPEQVAHRALRVAESSAWSSSTRSWFAQSHALMHGALVGYSSVLEYRGPCKP